MKKTVLYLITLLFSLFLNAQQKTYKKNYNADGVLIEEGWMENGQNSQYWTIYHPSTGEIHSKGHYKNDEKIGYWYYYNTNGTPLAEGHFKNDIAFNWWVFYDDRGKESFKCQYNEGVKHGYSLCYTKGKLVKSEKYVNDKKVGEWTSLASFKASNNIDDLK